MNGSSDSMELGGTILEALRVAQRVGRQWTVVGDLEHGFEAYSESATLAGVAFQEARVCVEQPG